ncbi:SGNH hydrolase-type esterase domain-containing protein [Penicillium cosmopolitanum]|uniref:SGNH hydrolase-type esterase domain-containing protein n=1 Tax=Penicillium cosmopolitanum TaxID=1131564 RepID=A0A9W9VZQ7_9EURO|nr:SGNH hydrolase-type esterase domain-containing protein [Penicillium cosmopolitanum]KAJ5392290.1 SGNH hydrolase-type esterase domain-containing protein [Penicillium cosmopolitanum]
MADQLHIASLGSSFAAGPAGALSAKLTDLTSSGATLLNITTEQQSAPFSKTTFAPQISKIPNDVDIITITAGGNDLGYIGEVLKDTWDNTLVGKTMNFFICAINAIKAIVTRAFRTPKHEPAASTISSEEFIDRMGGVIDEIHQKTPNAHIFLVEYLALFGTETTPGRDVAFGQERIDHHRNTASGLQFAYEKVASSRSEWCTRVPMHTISQNHALGSQEPWVEGLSMRLLFQRGPMFHPNLKGMEAVASELVKMIKKDN